jgi:hypothetical protein
MIGSFFFLEVLSCKCSHAGIVRRVVHQMKVIINQTVKEIVEVVLVGVETRLHIESLAS